MLKALDDAELMGLDQDQMKAVRIETAIALNMLRGMKKCVDSGVSFAFVCPRHAGQVCSVLDFTEYQEFFKHVEVTWVEIEGGFWCEVLAKVALFGLSPQSRKGDCFAWR